MGWILVAACLGAALAKEPVRGEGEPVRGEGAPVRGEGERVRGEGEPVEVHVPVAAPRLRVEAASTAAWSSDGGALAVGGEDGKVRVYDGRTLAPRRTLTLGEPVVSVAVGSGQVLAIGRDARGAWDLATGRPRTFPEMGLAEVRHVAFADGKLTAWGAVRADDGGRATEPARWTEAGLHLLAADERHAWLPSRGASADGARVAEGRGRAVLVAEGGRILREIPVAGANPQLWMRPDGQVIATLSKAGWLEVWDLGPALALDDGAEAIDARFRPGAPQLATLDTDGVVRVWDLASARAETVIPGWPGDEAAAIAWCPDGSCLVVAHGETVEVRRGAGWAVDAALALTPAPKAPAEVTAIDVTREGRVIVGTADGRGLEWAGVAGAAARTIFADLDPAPRETRGDPPHALPLRSVRVLRLSAAPDGRTVAAALSDGTARVWDLDGPTARANVTAPGSAPGALAWATDGALLLHAPETGVIARLFRGGELEVLAGSLTARGQVTSAAAWASRTAVARLQGAQPCPELPDLGEVRAWDLSADLRLVAAAHTGGGVGVWDAADGALVRWLQGPTPPVEAAIDPTGTVIYVGDAVGGTLLDVDTGARVHRLAAARGRGVFSGADGERLATLDAAGNVTVWEVSAGALLGVFPGEARRYALSPDGRFVAVGSRAGLRVYEVDTSLLAWEASGPADDDVAFSPDGRWLLARGGIDTVGVWATATGEVAPLFVGGRKEKAQAAAWGADGRVAWIDRIGTLSVGDPAASDGRVLVQGAEYAHGARLAWAGGTVVLQRRDGLAGWDATTGRRAWTSDAVGELRDDGALWPWGGGEVRRLDPRTGRTRARFAGADEVGGLLAHGAGLVVTEGPGEVVRIWSEGGTLRRAVSTLPDGDWMSWTPAGVLTGVDRHGRAVVRGPEGTVPAGLPGGALSVVPLVAEVVEAPVVGWAPAAAEGEAPGEGSSGCRTGAGGVGLGIVALGMVLARRRP